MSRSERTLKTSISAWPFGVCLISVVDTGCDVDLQEAARKAIVSSLLGGFSVTSSKPVTQVNAALMILIVTTLPSAMPAIDSKILQLRSVSTPRSQIMVKLTAPVM
jgi:hypothetical protein